MGETIVNQQPGSSSNIRTSKAPPATDHVPPLIDKKWLCHRFGLVLGSGLPNYPRLYTSVLTPDVLEALDIKPAEIHCRQFKTFNRVQTCALIRILEL